jgi:hypothetical protein
MRLVAERPGRARAGVTVVIPCYRYGQYLEAAVAAVLSQDDVDARVIIVDDASPDDSADVARRLAQSDARVRLIAHETNAGHIRTYNDGLREVETEFVALVSADDLVTPGALGRAVRVMQAFPRVGMVYGLPIEFVDGQGLPDARESRRVSWTVWPGRDWIRWACRRGRCFVLSPEVVMRTEALREVGEYDPALPHSGDLQFWLRTASRWDVARVNGPAQAYYRVHAANMHLTTYATMPVDLRERAAAFRTLVSAPVRAALPEADALLGRASRAIAREALLLAARELDAGGDLTSADALTAVAAEVSPDVVATRRWRGVARRQQRAGAGLVPTVAQGVQERLRHQVDRVRWRLWREVGIS